MDLFQHPSPSSKPISTLGVFALGALLSGLDGERRYLNLGIRYYTNILILLIIIIVTRSTWSHNWRRWVQINVHGHLPNSLSHLVSVQVMSCPQFCCLSSVVWVCLYFFSLQILHREHWV